MVFCEAQVKRYDTTDMTLSLLNLDSRRLCVGDVIFEGFLCDANVYSIEGQYASIWEFQFKGLAQQERIMDNPEMLRI